MMKQYYDFKMNYLLTIELMDGTKLQKEFESFNEFEALYDLIDYAFLDDERLNDTILLPGHCSCKVEEIYSVRGSYVEHPVEA